MPDVPTARWWTLLRGVSVLNVALWLGVVATVDVADPWRFPHLVCATVYVFVCAFRSFFPRVDLERYVLVDHPLSSIALGRTSATVAEMCFTLQCSFVLFELAEGPGPAFLALVGWSIVPLIAVAQMACWGGVVTLDHRWHAVEESLWAVVMAGVGVGLAAAVPGVDLGLRAVLGLGVVGCALSAYVMGGVDVPMYLRRARERRDAGVPLLSVREGFADALVRRVPVGDWDTWRHEVTWMTPYFSGGVWLSLLMAALPVA